MEIPGFKLDESAMNKLSEEEISTVNSLLNDVMLDELFQTEQVKKLLEILDISSEELTSIVKEYKKGK